VEDQAVSGAVEKHLKGQSLDAIVLVPHAL
jgi:hypothetical protein